MKANNPSGVVGLFDYLATMRVAFFTLAVLVGALFGAANASMCPADPFSCEIKTASGARAQLAARG